MATSAWSEFDFGLGDTFDEVRTQVRRLAVENRTVGQLLAEMLPELRVN